MSHFIPIPFKLGKVISVDSVYGNDLSAIPYVTPFKTINAAVSASIENDTLWIAPGTYNLSSPITLKQGCAFRGMSVQTTVVQMTNVTSDTTLMTIPDNCRIEDVTLTLSSTQHHNLIGIYYTGTASVTSKIRTTVINVDNSMASISGSSDLIGVCCHTSNSLGTANFSFNTLKGITVNVKSAGSGSKRGIMCSNGALTTRDFNLYVTGSNPGNYIGIEVSGSSAAVECRSSSIYGSTHDILQTSGSILIGPGCDLVKKSAGGKPFNVSQNPQMINFGAQGVLMDVGLTTPFTVYMMPGVSAIQPRQASPKYVAQYPASTPFNIIAQQNLIITDFYVNCITGSGLGTTQFYVAINNVKTALTATMTDGVTTVQNNLVSVNVVKGDHLSIRCEVSGSTPGATNNTMTDIDGMVTFF